MGRRVPIFSLGLKGQRSVLGLRFTVYIKADGRTVATGPTLLVVAIMFCNCCFNVLHFSVYKNVICYCKHIYVCLGLARVR